MIDVLPVRPARRVAVCPVSNCARPFSVKGVYPVCPIVKAVQTVNRWGVSR